MKVCIYGAGAIGGWPGHGLARAGASVTVVARGATLDALRPSGLQLTKVGSVTAQAVAWNAVPQDLGVQDVVVNSEKAPAMAEVAKSIEAQCGLHGACALLSQCTWNRAPPLWQQADHWLAVGCC